MAAARRKTRSRNSKKVAIVTGGGIGIGRGCANALARAGYAVAVVGRRAGRLQPRRGEVLHPYPCDVADSSQVTATVGAIVADLGRIDVVVNNAGVVRREPLEDISIAGIAQVVGINLIGTINVSLACLPALKRTKGAIINMSSSQAHKPLPGAAVYVATKGAIESLSKALAIELAPSGVRVNVVSPALVRSDIYIADGMSEAESDRFLIERRHAYPLGRIGEPSDVSELVLFLVSDKASWMTGTVIPVDGGRGVS